MTIDTQTPHGGGERERERARISIVVDAFFCRKDVQDWIYWAQDDVVLVHGVPFRYDALVVDTEDFDEQHFATHIWRIDELVFIFGEIMSNKFA